MACESQEFARSKKLWMSCFESFKFTAEKIENEGSKLVINSLPSFFISAWLETWERGSSLRLLLSFFAPLREKPTFHAKARRKEKLKLQRVDPLLNRPSSQGILADGTGLSPSVPKCSDLNPSVLCMLYQLPSDGRNTIRSVTPSPS